MTLTITIRKHYFAYAFSKVKKYSIIWEELSICNIRYTSTKTRFQKSYLFMIYERLRRYSHLPHQVANNGINCYDTKLSKYKKKLNTIMLT